MATTIGRILSPVVFVLALPILAALAIGILIRGGPRAFVDVVFNRSPRP